MSNRNESTPYFPGFQVFFKGRPNISQNELIKRKIKEIKSRDITVFQKLFANYLPSFKFTSHCKKHFTRNRVYNLEVIFYGFLNQIFINSSSCSEIVKKIQVWMISVGKKPPSSATGAYCKAKKKLSLSFIKDIYNHTVQQLLKNETTDKTWLNRSVKVLDGTGLSMPDTKENQKMYPQNKSMTPGCGFPHLNMVALFSLATGSLLGYKIGNKHNHESSLWKKLWHILKPHDIILADRGFFSYASIASLLMKNIDSVVRLRGKMKRFAKIRVLGKNDAVYSFKKAPTRSVLYSKDEWGRIPDYITVRVVRIPVTRTGFRSQEFIIVTTLLDHTIYTPEALGELYFRRWTVELNLRDIKTTMGMDILKSKTPRQIEKEVVMFAIGYNLIRSLILNSSSQTGNNISKISFAGTVQQLNQWLCLFTAPDLSLYDFRQLLYQFYNAIAQHGIPDRPGTSRDNYIYPSATIKNTRVQSSHVIL